METRLNNADTIANAADKYAVEAFADREAVDTFALAFSPTERLESDSQMDTNIARELVATDNWLRKVTITDQLVSIARNQADYDEVDVNQIVGQAVLHEAVNLHTQSSNHAQAIKDLIVQKTAEGSEFDDPRTAQNIENLRIGYQTNLEVAKALSVFMHQAVANEQAFNDSIKLASQEVESRVADIVKSLAEERFDTGEVEQLIDTETGSIDQSSLDPTQLAAKAVRGWIDNRSC